MMRLTLIAVVLTMAKMSADLLAADTWCWANHPDALFCEDFDRYCVDPPPAPGRCEPQDVDIRDPAAMWQLWDAYHNCGWVMGLHDEYCSSPPYCAKIGCQAWNNELGYGNMGLNSFIRDKFGSDFSEVRATDLTPLTLEFAMNARIGTRIQSANLYVELGRGRSGILLPDENTITNWAISDNCRLCGDSGEQDYYPIICRQSPAPAGCAGVDAAPVVPALAAGALAFLDSNPCHCGEARGHWPYTTHLAFFDGLQWHTLRKGLFPDPGGSELAPGDFGLVDGDVQHRVRLTVRTATVTVELRVGSPVVLSRCEIPRVYLGSFTSMLVGYQTPCQVEDGTWSCNGALDCNGPCGPAKTCCVSGAPGGGTVAVDDIVLSGGQGYAEAGVCCLPDTSCLEDTFQGDCQAIGGSPGDPGSTCGTTACCPPLMADHDMDGDVDVQDFGWLQTCLTGLYVPPETLGCTCADLDHDGDVETSDIEVFIGCMLGPEIPADPSCMN